MSESVLKKVNHINYNQGVTPMNYRCGECGAWQVRLWRLPGSDRLFCAHCAEMNQRTFHEEGWKSNFLQGRGNNIGDFIPAIPIPDKYGFWDFADIPPGGIKWWKELPVERYEKD